MNRTRVTNTDEVKQVVKDCLEEFIDARTLQQVTDTTPLITGGLLDSITLVELVASLEDHFGIKFQSHEMSVDYFDNLADIASTVEAKLQERP